MLCWSSTRDIVRIAIALLAMLVLGSVVSDAQPQSRLDQLIGDLDSDDIDSQNEAALELATIDSDKAVSALTDWIEDDLDNPPKKWSEVTDILIERNPTNATLIGFLDRLAAASEDPGYREKGIGFMVERRHQNPTLVRTLFVEFGGDFQYIRADKALEWIPALGGRSFLEEAQQALENDKECEGAVVLLREQAEITKSPDQVVSTTRAALRTRGRGICPAAIGLLRSFGFEARSAVSELTALLMQAESDTSEKNLPTSLAVGAAIANIGLDVYDHAERFSRAELTEQIDVLERGQEQFAEALKPFSAMSSDDFESLSLAQRSMRIAIKGLTDNRARRIVEPVRDGVVNTVREHPIVSAVLGYVVFMLLLRVVLLRVWPLGLLRLNEFLNRVTDSATGQDLGVWGAPVAGVLTLTRWLSVVGLLKHPQRSLDAWVAARLPAARERFEKLPTVSRRNVYVTLPLVMDGALVTDPSPRSFHPAFRQGPTRLLICGEGGAGKTSLAAQLGRWGMRGGIDGLCPHALLPVLIEQDLDAAEDGFFHAVRGRLQDLIGEAEPLSEQLTEQLLRDRRVLVIVDGLSERSGATRDLVQPTDPRFSAAALVVTSRRQESLAGAIITRVEPVRVRGDRLSSFMEAYLQQLGARSLFSDIEYFDACRRLSVIVGQRDTTVLLARLYAELLVARKSEDAGSRAELPTNVPDLMFAYLNTLNRERGPEDPDDLKVHNAARIVAWESVNTTYQPGAARRSRVLQGLGDDGEQTLRYLESRLAIVQSTGPAQDFVRLTLDPLAEYLAADHLARTYSDDSVRWQSWLTDFAVRVKDIGPENLTGFSSALLECLAAHGHELGVPHDVPSKFEALSHTHLVLSA
jgi:hypothetical protein